MGNKTVEKGLNEDLSKCYDRILNECRRTIYFMIIGCLVCDRNFVRFELRREVYLHEFFWKAPNFGLETRVQRYVIFIEVPEMPGSDELYWIAFFAWAFYFPVLLLLCTRWNEYLRLVSNCFWNYRMTIYIRTHTFAVLGL